MKTLQLILRIYMFLLHVAGTLIMLAFLADQASKPINILLVVLCGAAISVLFVLVMYHGIELYRYIRKNKSQKPQKPENL